MKALSNLASSRRVGELRRRVWGLLGGPEPTELIGRARDIMTVDVGTCDGSEPLARAAQIMWDRDCGLVVVVGADGRPVGVVTDRDLCMASLTQGRALAAIATSAAVSGQLHTCSPDDPLSRCRELMQSHRVRRLVVVGDAGRLEGVVSLADIARHVLRRPASDLGAHVFLATLVGSLSRPWRASSPAATLDAGAPGEAAPDAG